MQLYLHIKKPADEDRLISITWLRYVEIRGLTKHHVTKIDRKYET